MKYNHVKGRLATFGLIALLLVLAVFSIGAALISEQLANKVEVSVYLNDQYQPARFAVGAEESLERKYRLEPSPDVRASHRAAADMLVNVLNTVYRDGNGNDRALVERVLSEHKLYLIETNLMFVAVDAHDTARVILIDHTYIDPVFNQIQQQVNTAANEHHLQATQSLTELNQTQSTILKVTPVVFGVGLFLLLLFWKVVRKYQINEAAQAERALLLEQMALTDSLTDLPNHRTMMDRIEEELARCQRTQQSCALVFVDLDHFKHINDAWGHRAGDAVLREASCRLKKSIRREDAVGRYGGEEFVMMLPNTDLHAAKQTAERLRVALAEEPCLLEPEENGQAGNVIAITGSIGIAVYGEHGTTRAALIEAADRAMYYAKQMGRNQVRLAGEETALTPQVLASMPQGRFTETIGVKTLAAVASVHDGKTSAHAHRIVRLAEATARNLGRSEEEIHLVRLAALFHDIGKIGIPDAILHKPGPLTEEEWIVMRRHPVLGQHILEQVGGVFELLSHIVVAHHERWDGRGYPFGLAQSAIPLAARILTVVDSYDAMTSQRPYRQPLSGAQARDELQRCAGSQYDPQVVEMFLLVLDADEQPQTPVLMEEMQGDATPSQAGGEALDREVLRT